MVFSSLAPEIQYQIYKLTSDDQFQERFGKDKTLDQLEDLKYDPFVQYCQFQLLQHNKLDFNGVDVEPLTLALWGFLYTIKNPIVVNEQNITMVDVNLFFYLLQTKNFKVNLKQLYIDSMNYCSQKMGLTDQQAVDIFRKLLQINFRVLNMFPRLQTDKKPVYNADWITSIVTKVHQVSSYTTEQLYNQISFCQIYYMFAQYCRENGSEAIYLRTEEEIQIQIDKRSTELVVDRLIEKNVIEAKDRDYYIKEIHVIKEKE